MSVRILILEDDPLIALDLVDIVENRGHEIVDVCNCNAVAEQRLDGDVDFALLDVDVRDGKTFRIAAALAARGIPFAFVSGSRPADLPEDLRDARFVAKPFDEAAIVRSLPR